MSRRRGTGRRRPEGRRYISSGRERHCRTKFSVDGALLGRAEVLGNNGKRIASAISRDASEGCRAVLLCAGAASGLERRRPHPLGQTHRGCHRPFVGEIQRLVPGLELESRLVLDLSQHLFLSHHAFLNIPDGLKPVEERLPTLPLTFELEILSEVAEALVPGLRVIACHDSRGQAMDQS